MRGIAALAVVLFACGDDHQTSSTCTPPAPFSVGDPDGHPDPLGSTSTEARAGRIHAAQLPTVSSGLVTWKDNDFVLANDKVALVIEDVGDSDLYDPWGGRPVGVARVANGQLVEPANFGEFFLLTGRSTVVTDSVTVLNDGTDGQPAVIRTTGKLHPLPFYENVISALYHDALTDIDAAIDYSLAPSSESVDITYRYISSRADDTEEQSILHAMMYTERTPVYQPTLGFDSALANAPYIALVDDDGTSWGYIPSPDNGPLGSAISVSGFLGAFTTGFTIGACAETDRLHASLVIGGPGLDGILQAVSRTRGESQREITGTVTRGSVPAAGIRVHAIDTTNMDAYLTRATTDASGHYTLHVPASAQVRFDAFERGNVMTSSTASDFDMPATGLVHVQATESGTPVPVRIQLLPTTQTIDNPPAQYGEDAIAGGRLQVVYSTTGDTTLQAPPGQWKLVVSRGYEYELVEQTVTVTANATTTVTAAMDHSVATPNTMCGDFHIHTWRSNDSGDRSLTKIAQAAADGLELPVRSDHEWVGDFEPEIAQLDLQPFMKSISSVELTSFEVWGHMGVVPLVADPTKQNNGSPKWQSYPTAADGTLPFETMSPPAVFDAVRARPEAPVVIINHPHSGANYFPYVGYDAATGTASDTASWDTKFTLIEVFNDSDWTSNRTGTVEDWLGILRAGRKVFAVGSSDSHGIASSPVGYPRTCLPVGDDPQSVAVNDIRDELAAGHGTVSGGIYVTAKLGDAGPGDTTTGAGVDQMVDVEVQAASWIDVTAIEVIVDGETVDTIPILPSDAITPVIRYHAEVPVNVRAAGGFVVIAAYGTKAMEPVHPGRIPFGMANPIFVTP
ncbi:MAG: CehA/McbA family metallohydrolase [Kofleriaceae bacterium]